MFKELSGKISKRVYGFFNLKPFMIERKDLTNMLSIRKKPIFSEILSSILAVLMAFIVVGIIIAIEGINPIIAYSSFILWSFWWSL